MTISECQGALLRLQPKGAKARGVRKSSAGLHTTALHGRADAGEIRRRLGSAVPRNLERPNRFDWLVTTPDTPEMQEMSNGYGTVTVMRPFMLGWKRQ